MATNFGAKIAINAHKWISTTDSENVITYNRGVFVVGQSKEDISDRRFIRPKTVTHPHGGGESNSRPLSRKADGLTRRQSHYSTGSIVVHDLLFNIAA